MADASRVQSSFLGGEWSPYSQGRFDHPAYKSGLASCLNSYPIPEGAWARRPGFQYLGVTRKGAAGRTISFDYAESASYHIEATNGFLRMWAGNSRVFTDDITAVAAISTANPAVVTLAVARPSWATGGAIEFQFQSWTDASVGSPLRMRRFTITQIDNTHFSLADELTGANVDGSTLNWNPAKATVKAAHLLEIVTPYTGGIWSSLRAIIAANVGPQGQSNAILLQNTKKPQVLVASSAVPSAANTQGFTLSPQDFVDGPYLDPVAGSLITVSAASGPVILALSYQAYSATQGYQIGEYVTYSGTTYISLTDGNLGNQPDISPTQWSAAGAGAAVGPNGFVSTDVGRLMRLLSEPQVWAAGATYASGTLVKYSGTYYLAGSNASAGLVPPQTPTVWQPYAPSYATTWVWGRVTAVLSSTSVTFNPIGWGDGATVPFAYYNVTPVTSWRMGVYSDTTGWPTCGTYYEGRLVLCGVIGNRMDASVSNDIYNFSPTAYDGTVGAANAITAVFNANSTNAIYWIEETAQGLIAATRTGEWLISAPAQGSLAPTNIAAHRVTRVKAANILPAQTPLAMVMADKYGRELLEYFPEVFSGKLTSPNLNVFAKHLTVGKVLELTYQSELAPLLWARCGDGTLVGCTYRRENAYGSEAPTFSGFHRHTLGGTHTCESISAGPSADLTQDTLRMVEFDPVSGYRHLTTSRPLIDQTAPITAGWFVDDGVVPQSAQTSTVNGMAGITFYGLWHLNGETATAVIGGLDCGDYTVTNGSMFVPFGSDSAKTLTLAYLQALNATGGFGDMGVTLDNPAYTFPAIVGFTFTSNGQLLRPIAAPDVGAQNGPALAKTRRAHQFSALFAGMVPNTVSFGTTFSDLRPAIPANPNGSALPPATLYSGVHWGTLDDDYSFDSQICWQVTRPVPCTIAAVGWFGHSMDR